MNTFNIYLTGVGGQGIGLISEVLLRAADYAGFGVKSVDTHGLAQRGGAVISQIRMGSKVYAPLIPAGKADLAVSLERHEALRAVDAALKNNGDLIYYDTVWQPLAVRLGQAEEVSVKMIEDCCMKRGITVTRVHDETLIDVRMQNMVVLAGICKRRLIPGIDVDHYRQAMDDLMAGRMLEENFRVFENRIKG